MSNSTHPTRTSHLRVRLLSLGVSLLLLVAVTVWFLLHPTTINASWFDDSYAYREKITIGNSGTADSDKKVKLDIDTSSFISNGKMQSDCDDTRFTDSNGKVLKYFLDSAGGACNTTSTDYYVLLPTINGASNTIIYMYYGNPSTPAGTEAAQFSQATFSPTSGPTEGSEEKGPTPLLYWKFDEGTGTTAKDSSTNANNGTLIGPTIQSEDLCILGKCLKFDGSNDTVSKSYSSDKELDVGTGDFTVSAWLKHSSTVSGTDTLIARSNGAVNGIGYKVYMKSSGVLCFGIDDDATSFPDDEACSATTSADSQWHFVEAVKSGTASITLYIDGTQAGQDTSIAASGSLSGSSPTFYVGIDGDGASNPWDGFIDEVKLYNYAKTSSQVKTDLANRGSIDQVSASFGYQDPTKSLSSGLMGYWKMDETSGDATDASGNSVTLTNNNTTPFNAGKFANAATFNGSNRYFSAGATLSNVQTISFWAKPANTTDNYSNLASGVYITSNSGAVTASGITSPTIYVNGVQTSTIEANTWQLVTITTPTGISADAFEVGRANGSLAVNNSQIDDVRIYNRALKAHEVAALYDWAPGPVGHWKLDENTGTACNDSSGSGNNGTFSTKRWTVGKYGAGVASIIDAIQDSCAVADPASGILDFSNTQDYTTEIWVKDISDEASHAILYKGGTSSTTSGYDIEISASTNTAKCNYVDGNSGNGNSDSAIGTSTIRNDGKWHHIACVMDRSGTATRTVGLHIFVDGKLEGSDTSLTETSGENTRSVHIGEAGTTIEYNGSVDDARIYNYARTSKQIISDMNAGHQAVGTPVGSAVGHWSFDEGYGTTANDKSPNNNNLTLSAASWTTSGKFGKAWNGTGSVWLTRNDDDDFDFAATDDMSISMWFKSDSATNPSSETQYLLSKGTITNTGTAGYAIYAKTDGTIVYGIKDDAAWGASSPTTPAPDDTATSTSDLYDGTWHHLVATKTRTSRIDLYIDGKLNASDTSLAATGSLANSIALRVGDDDADATNSFAGDIDELKIYRYELKADEVRTEYNQGKSQVLGSTSTASDAITPDNSSAREYCIPGDTSACNAPIGEWKFDEKTGTTANDTSGNGTAVTLKGNTKFAVGKIGSALQFDGVTGTVADASAVSLLQTLGDISVGIWLNAASATNGNHIASVRGGGETEPDNEMWLLEWNTASGNDIRYRHEDGAGNNNNLDFDTNLSLNTWYHIEFTRDTTAKTVSLYLNGALVSTKSYTNQPTGGSTSNLRIGAAGSSSSSTYQGKLDNLIIYNYKRTPAQVAWDYNRGAPIGNWKFDECQGGTAYDASGNRLNGTLAGTGGTNTGNGTCTNVDTATKWYNGRNGKFNSSLDFDGTDDNVSVGDNTIHEFSNGTDFTISVWVKSALTSTGTVLAKKTSTGATTSGYDLRLSSTGTLDFYASDGTNQYQLTKTSAVSANSWTHLLIVYDDDSTTNTDIYINGVKSNASPTGTLSSVGNVGVNSNALKIGSEADDQDYFKGQLDDLRIYNYALTPQQILMDMNQSSALRFGPSTGQP